MNCYCGRQVEYRNTRLCLDCTRKFARFLYHLYGLREVQFYVASLSVLRTEAEISRRLGVASRRRGEETRERFVGALAEVGGKATTSVLRGALALSKHGILYQAHKLEEKGVISREKQGNEIVWCLRQ